MFISHKEHLSVRLENKTRAPRQEFKVIHSVSFIQMSDFCFTKISTLILCHANTSPHEYTLLFAVVLNLRTIRTTDCPAFKHDCQNDSSTLGLTEQQQDYKFDFNTIQKLQLSTISTLKGLIH